MNRLKKCSIFYGAFGVKNAEFRASVSPWASNLATSDTNSREEVPQKYHWSQGHHLDKHKIQICWRGRWVKREIQTVRKSLKTETETTCFRCRWSKEKLAIFVKKSLKNKYPLTLTNISWSLILKKLGNLLKFIGKDAKLSICVSKVLSFKENFAYKEAITSDLLGYNDILT